MIKSFVILPIALLLLASFGSVSSVQALDWLPEETIDSTFKECHSPQVAVDGHGRAIAIWYQDVGTSNTQNRLYASVFIPGEGWGTPLMIQNGDYNVDRFALDISPDGQVSIAHMQGNSLINIRTFEIGSGWGIEELVYSAQGINTYIGEIRLEVNAQGDAILAWTERYTGYDSLRAMLLIEGEWGEPLVIAEGSRELSEINIALNDRGDAMAAWNTLTGGFTNEVRASKYSQGDWSSPELISSSDTYSSSPRLGMDNSGKVIVVWTQKVAENFFNSYSNNYSPEDGWGAPRNIQNGTADSRAPCLAMNAVGEAFAVWQQNYDGKLSLTANRYAAGNGWLGAERLENGNWNGRLPSVGLAEDGAAIVVWIPENAQELRALRFAEGAWGQPEELQSTAGWIENIDFDVGRDGSAAVVWEQDNDARTVYLPAELKLTVDSPMEGSTVNETKVKVTGRTNPNAEVVINGIDVHVNVSGEFYVEVPLLDGQNRIEVTASSPYDVETTVIIVTCNDPLNQALKDLDHANEEIEELRTLIIAASIIGVLGMSFGFGIIFFRLKGRKR